MTEEKPGFGPVNGNMLPALEVAAFIGLVAVGSWLHTQFVNKFFSFSISTGLAAAIFILAFAVGKKPGVAGILSAAAFLGSPIVNNSKLEVTPHSCEVMGRYGSVEYGSKGSTQSGQKKVQLKCGSKVTEVPAVLSENPSVKEEESVSVLSGILGYKKI